MLVIPFQVTGQERGPVLLVMILEKENMDRMRQGDPFDVQLKQILSLDQARRIRDLDIVIAYEEDIDKIIGFKERGDWSGLIEWIERGRKHQVGDCQPPVQFRRT